MQIEQIPHDRQKKEMTGAGLYHLKLAAAHFHSKINDSSLLINKAYSCHLIL